MTKLRRHTVIPGFGLTLGYSVSYLSLIVLIPLSALVARGVGQPFSEFRAAVFDPSCAIASGEGPIKVIPAAAQARANSWFSARKP